MLIRLRNQDKIAIHNSYDAYKVMQHILKRDTTIDLTKEHFWTIALNRRKIIVNIELLGIGSSYRVVVPLNDIFCIPYQKKAVSLLLIHNHPSGSCVPSEIDIDFTDRVMRMGDIMHIKVVDHLILGGDRGKTNLYCSLKDQQIMENLQFSTKYLLRPEAEALFMQKITELHEIREQEQELAHIILKERTKMAKQEGIKLGEEKGSKERERSIAKHMLKDGESIEKIMRYTGLSKLTIHKLNKELE